MRKIISKQEEERKKKRNQFIIGGILIFVMLTSLIGYAFQSQTGSNSANTINYNGIIFTKNNGFWTTDYGGGQIKFTYAPSQTPASDLANLTKNINDFLNKPLYIYSEDSNAENEIRINLAQFAAEVINACPEGTECGDGIPAKTCSDNFIVIQEGEENVKQEQDCIFIRGQGEDLIKLTDNVLFEIFGVK